MKHTRHEKILYLFREIGEIDDSLIHEAQTYRPRRMHLPTRWLTVAAALLLCVSLVIAGGLLEPLFQKNSGEAPDIGAESEMPMLDRLLASTRGTGVAHPLSHAQDAPYFDGQAYIVWQFVQDGALFISDPLSKDQLLRLTRALEDGESVGGTSPTLTCRVWILPGDGSVLSPYLPNTPGNIGTAELFDYQVEQIPSDALTSCISDILRQTDTP